MSHRKIGIIPPGKLFALLLVAAYATRVAAEPSEPVLQALQREVADTERAFAQSMTDRDHAAFMSFLSDEAVFFSGPTPLRGKQQVGDAWEGFFEGPAAPFSWAPEDVQVLDSGSLALSTGPVRDPAGKVVATFTSIWRREAPGTWRIVFDKGCEVCQACD